MMSIIMILTSTTHTSSSSSSIRVHIYAERCAAYNEKDKQKGGKTFQVTFFDKYIFMHIYI